MLSDLHRALHRTQLSITGTWAENYGARLTQRTSKLGVQTAHSLTYFTTDPRKSSLHTKLGELDSTATATLPGLKDWRRSL